MTPRVLVATTYYHPVVGGVETHARQVVRHLRARGFPVQVLTKRVAREHKTEDVVDAVPVHRVGPAGERSGSGKWIALPSFFASVMAMRSAFDVLVCIDYRGIGVGIVAAGRLLGRPVIVQAGTAGVLSSPASGSGLPPESGLDRALRGLPRAFYRAADHFVCIARDIERETLAAGVAPERVHYLPHGVDVSRFRPALSPERDSLRAGFQWPADKTIVLFVGRLSVEKGVLELIEAWKILNRRDALLVFVGPDMPGHPWDAGPAARGFAANPEFGGTVRVLGATEDPAPFYRAADLFVQPSRFEAFGISAVEAMASGVAVVASRVGGLGDFLSHETNALLSEPANPQSLADALRLGLDRPELRSRLAAAALRTARERFDERVLLDEYASLIRSAVRAR